jgi:hypothetical protein
MDFEVVETAVRDVRIWGRRRSGWSDLLEDPVERQTPAAFDGDDGDDGDDQQ